MWVCDGVSAALRSAARVCRRCPCFGGVHRRAALLKAHRATAAVASFGVSDHATWKVDHLVYGVEDLQEGMEHFHRLTGVQPRVGGRHEGLGTHNAIFSLGDQTYFEIIAPDPTQRPDCPVPKWMGMDGAPMPRLLTWAARLAHPGDADFEKSVNAARLLGYDPGTVRSYQRKAGSESEELLRWRLAYNHTTWPLPGDGLIPFLIDWEPRSMKRVNDAAQVAGTCRFLGLEAQHPSPREVEEVLGRLGGVQGLSEIKQADEGALWCLLDTPNGTVKV